jgi:hypothetical protein
MGIGLFHSKMIVEATMATIEVETRGKGAEFKQEWCCRKAECEEEDEMGSKDGRWKDGSKGKKGNNGIWNDGRNTKENFMEFDRALPCRNPAC